MTFRTLVAIVAIVFASGIEGAGQQQKPVGANPPADLLQGAIDFHIHAYPDAFGRSLADRDLAELARRKGMRAIVIKSHVSSTAERAELASQQVPGIEVFGGLALNRTVGGLNIEAIEAMARTAGRRGRIVWLPTIDAQYYGERLGAAGKSILPGKGIRVAENGRVSPEMMKVLEKVKEHDLILETGHVSPDEVLAVIKTAAQMGMRKLVVTHAMATVPGLSIAQMKQVAADGGYLELVVLNDMMGPTGYVEWTQHWKRVSIAEMAEAVRQVGADHFVLSTDLGASGLAIPTDGYQTLIGGLQAAGISRPDIEKMMRENPAKLLGLPPSASK